MATRKRNTTSRARKRSVRHPRADLLVLDTLRKVADPRVSAAELKRSGIHLPAGGAKLRERARLFLRNARKVSLGKNRRKSS